MRSSEVLDFEDENLRAVVEDALRWANSYSRADALVDVFAVDHPRREELLGEEWSSCDVYPDAMRRIIAGLPRPCWRAMDDVEREAYGNLAESVTLWRGCYAENRSGLSWSLSRETAAGFPSLNRYRRPGQPMIIEARIRRERIAFLKLDRREQEVICDPNDVEIVDEVPLEAA
jgi:hypothetical protein